MIIEREVEMITLERDVGNPKPSNIEDIRSFVIIQYH
jgi:hypothetical protein